MKDSVVKVSASDDMVKKLKELGADVTYSRMEKIEPNAWDYAYNEILLERKRICF